MNIKSVGYLVEGGGEIIDDREWSGDFQEQFDDGDVVSFEEGMSALEEYVLTDGGESEDGAKKWPVIEMMLLGIREEVGNEGKWILWGVDADMSLGVVY